MVRKIDSHIGDFSSEQRVAIVQNQNGEVFFGSVVGFHKDVYGFSVNGESTYFAVTTHISNGQLRPLKASIGYHSAQGFTWVEKAEDIQGSSATAIFNTDRGNQVQATITIPNFEIDRYLRGLNAKDIQRSIDYSRPLVEVSPKII